MNKSQIKTWLRKSGFRPIKGVSWRDSMKYGGGVFRRSNRLFRIRDNEHEFSGGDRRWTIDISCIKSDFDRWANSTNVHALPLEEFIRLSLYMIQK